MTVSGTDVTGAQSIREQVREKYAERAQNVAQGAIVAPNPDPITSNLYDLSEQQELPAAAVLASLGCGNPTALAQLNPGEVVLDLGSGGGIDVLLSARRVGPTGFAFGLDMTDEMLQLAERNKQESGLKNVSFLKGHIEEIPLPNESVDVIISNCVINLSADKSQVLREAFRVLRPGGRFAVSDVVAQGELPDDLRKDMEAWVGCVAGALEEQAYRQLLADAGFTDITIEATRVYDPTELQASLTSGSACCGSTSDASCCGTAPEWNTSAYERYAASGGRLISGFIRAAKPGGAAKKPAPVLPQATLNVSASCCGPDCCAS